MPEGDTVFRTAQRLDAVFAGQALTRCDLRWPSLSTVDLTGATTTAVVPAGKHLLHRFDNGWTLHTHLRMEGKWRIKHASERVPSSPDARAILGTDAYTAIGWLLGEMDLVRTGEEHTLVGHLGPDLLSPTWDAGLAERAASNLAARTDPIGAALLDQRVMAGLGTIWTSEPLFATRLHPFDVPALLPRRALDAVIATAHRMLVASVSVNGGRHTARGPSVYGRRGEPCRRCGTRIETLRVGVPPRDRQLFFCPTCQPRRTPDAP